MYPAGSFTRLDDIAADPNAWDDTELVAAFNAAVSCYPGVASHEGKTDRMHSRAPDASNLPAQHNVMVESAAPRIPIAKKAIYQGQLPPDAHTERESESYDVRTRACAAGQPLDKGGESELPGQAQERNIPKSSGSRFPIPEHDTAENPSGKLLLPPPPFLAATNSEMQTSLEKLLASYYEAGYRAGWFEAVRQTRNNE